MEEDGGEAEQFLDQMMGRFAAYAATPLTEGDIASLDDESLDERLWARIFTLVGRGDRPSLMSLPPGLRMFFLTRHFEWEVGNGGVWQYVENAINNEGTNFDLIADGYDLLMLPDRADLVRTVGERMRPFGPLLLDGSDEPIPDDADDLELHDNVLSELPDDQRLAYVRAHAAEFAI